MGFENKLMVDSQGRHMMNDFQRAVWISSEITEQVQLVLLRIKNSGYKLPVFVSISVDGIASHLTDDPVIKKAIIKKSRKAGLKMADVEIAPNATPEQIKAAEDKAIEKLEGEEDKVDADQDPKVQAVINQLDSDLEAFIIAVKPEDKLSKQERRRRHAAQEHLDAKAVLQAAGRLSKSANEEDRKAAKNALEMLMGNPDEISKAEAEDEKLQKSPGTTVLYLEQEREKREEELKAAEEKAAKEKKPGDAGGKP